MESLIGFIVAAAVLAAVIYLPYRWIKKVVSRGREINQLAQEGLTLYGNVEKKEHIKTVHAGSDHFYITYSFHTDNDKRYEKRVSVSMSEWKEIVEHQPIKICYLPADPTVSAMDSMVETVRRHGQR